MRRLVYLLWLTVLPLLATRCPAKNKAAAATSPARATSPVPAPATAACPPDKIRAKIAELKAQPKANPAFEVWSYTYKGQLVYLVTADCCDQYTTVYDACLNMLCAPSGGFTGRGDGQCPDFNEKATDKKLVWRDPRQE
jgi:hypothetical protein